MAAVLLAGCSGSDSPKSADEPSKSWGWERDEQSDSVTWSWVCPAVLAEGQECRFRQAITMSEDHTFAEADAYVAASTPRISVVFDEDHADFDTDGTYYLHVQYQVVDGEGNEVSVSEVRTSEATSVDFAAPSLTGLSNDSDVAMSKTWNWGCNESACTYRYVVNSMSSHVFEDSVEFGDGTSATQSTGDGMHYLHIQARDAAGNTSAVESYSVTLDNTAPTVNGLSNDQVATNSKTWTWTCSETCTYRFVVNDQSSHSFAAEAFAATATATKTGVDGTYYLHVQAKDEAGNESDVVSVSAVLSTAAVAVTGISSDTSPVSSKTWTWSCSRTSCTYRHLVNQNPTHTFEAGDAFGAVATASQTSGDGTYYLHVQAQSGSETSAVLSVSAVLDNTAPSVTGLADDSSSIQSKTWTWDCNESPCTYRHIINQTSTHTFGSETFNSTATATQSTGTGRYYIHVQAQDVAGNIGDVVSVTAVLDNTPPDLLFGNQAARAIPAQTQTWSWISLAEAYRHVVNQNPTHTFTTEPFQDERPLVETVTQSSGDGTYYLHVQGRDSAGNISQVYSEAALLDNTAPTLTGLSSDTTGMSSKTWNWGCSDATGCEYRFVVDQSATAPNPLVSSWLPDTSVVQAAGNGTFYLHIQVRDPAGNESAVASYSAILVSAITFTRDADPTSTAATWNWACPAGVTCTYRHMVNTMATHTFESSDTYGATTSASVTPRFGNYLHVQRTDSSDSSESEVLTLFSNALTRISSDRFTTCTVLSTGGIQCWGAADRKTLGNGAAISENATFPVDVTGISNAVQVAVGNEGACAVLQDESVKCWGQNTWGILGNGTFTDSATPVDVSNLNGIVQVDVGNIHACALGKGGRVQCWGNNGNGRLGSDLSDRSRQDRSNVPVDVPGLSGVVALAIGSFHSCALLNSGGIKCWGSGSNGHLGNGSNSHSTSPVDVTGITNAVQISAGSNHTCAVLATGAVKCWGQGDNGRLGNNHATNDNSNVPVDVAGVTGAIKVSAGDRNACAVLSTGAIKCWGEGSDGQLGNGASRDSKVVVDVTGLTTAAEVVTGHNHSCALLTTGGVKCWGRANSGRLGQGAEDDSTNTPVDVVVSNEDSAAASAFGTTWSTSSCYKAASASSYECKIDD